MKKKSRSKKLTKSYSGFSNFKKALMFSVIFAFVGMVLLISSYANPSPYDDVRQAHLVTNPQRGEVYQGLKAVKVSANHPCKGNFEVAGAKPNGQPLCTHGPDPAPDGIDVTDANFSKRVDQLATLPENVTTTSQLQTMSEDQIINYAAHITIKNSIPYGKSAVPCTSGRYRIQLVLITHSAGTDKVAAQMKATALRTESELEFSALHSGPNSTNRHFRFVTDGNCAPIVKRVITPNGYKLNTPDSAINYLAKHGYKDPHTKYLVWVYSGNADFCGIGTTYGDSHPSVVNNRTNKGTGYAVIGNQCFGSNAELHEIMHTLGAVETDSPHTSGGGHCLDEHDVMCYPDNDHTPCKRADGTKFDCGANGKQVKVVAGCTKDSLEYLLDCNNDDYFNSGSVNPNSYLGKHWNVAHSPYLQ